MHRLVAGLALGLLTFAAHGADLCWPTSPDGQARLDLVSLPAGTHGGTFVIEDLDGQGGRIAWLSATLRDLTRAVPAPARETAKAYPIAGSQLCPYERAPGVLHLEYRGLAPGIYKAQALLELPDGAKGRLADIELRVEGFTWNVPELSWWERHPDTLHGAYITTGCYRYETLGQPLPTLDGWSG